MFDVMRIAAILLLALGCGSTSAQPDAGVDAAVACVADCECLSRCCRGGLCRDGCGGIVIGLCGDGDAGTCRCEGGTCDPRGCCHGPDGRIDDGTGPICMPGG
jgi:hypothetical protein